VSKKKKSGFAKPPTISEITDAEEASVMELINAVVPEAEAARDDAELTEQDLPVHPAMKDFFGMTRHWNLQFNETLAMRYLAYYAITGRKGDSARAVGVSYSTVNRWEKEHAVFGEMVLEAHELHLNRLERELYRRAVEGVEEPVFAGKDGDLVGHIRKFSDKLLEVALRKADPTGYGGKEAVQVNVNTGVLLAPQGHTEENTPLTIEDVEE